VTARELALRVVCDVFPVAGVPERGAQASFDYRARKAGVGDRDRAFAAELAYGAIKMRRALDWYLEPFVGSRRGTLPPQVLEILRLAAYELIYTRADVYATVFEFVNLAKRCSHRGLANLVNAVLRAFLRADRNVPRPDLFETDDEYLATKCSLPTWLVRQWRETFGERVGEICERVNDPAQGAIVVDARKATREHVAEALAASGTATHPSEFAGEALIVDGSLSGLPSPNGRWWVQSESSAMPVDVLAPEPGERVLDVCSGRGNKALQILGRLGGEGTLTCLEADPRKVEVLTRRLDEAGAAAGIVCGNAADAILPAQERFDRALVDAPCSGTGVVGRHPEARWKKQGTDGERLALTQRALLARTALHIHPGGELVYAVCSTDPRETTEVMDWFLSRENFERGLVPAAYAPLLTAAGDVLVPPGIGGRDGFFIARVQRRA